MPVAVQKILTYLLVFASGGLLCMLAQLLIVRTKLTPARILVIFLCAGILLEAVGVFKYMLQYAKAGVSVPILGFGAALAKGAIEGAKTLGFMGAFAGGLTATAMGIGVAVCASFVVTLIFSPRTK
ncbi:MAG: SpoVA/SpoVAEb family sporulation membrane protein [Firmicutes bacterium]|nr:SpoVA/SpoVAEb family sporulation membrane protein [Bacillota bacterium]